MGGAATKHLGTQRIPQHRYDEIIAILGEFNCRPAKTFPKPDHGDVDVICTPEVRDEIIKVLNITATVRNGNVWSCVYEMGQEKYQIDFITTAKEKLDYTAKWYCYGNMSLLIGRVIPKELKFAYDALKLRSCDKPIIRDFDKALEFLGFDVEKFNKGFSTTKEMLDWIASSKYFVHDGLINNWRNSSTKHRDKKRTTLDEEIVYLLYKPEKTKMPQWHYLDRQATKKRHTYLNGLNRLKRIKNKYCLSVEEYMVLYKDFQENPLKWVANKSPVDFDYDTKLNEQRDLVFKLAKTVNLNLVISKTTKRKLAWGVGRLKEAGFQDQDLVKLGVSPALLKEW